MKSILLSMALFACVSAANAQNEELLRVFKDQVAAFNEGDVDRLTANVTDDFKWFSLTADTLLLEVEGKENFRQSMKYYFSAGQKSVSTIEQYAVDGERISFREVVSHQNKAGETVSSSAMGIYQIQNGKISRAWYFID
ncbi:nuclear transport factor 2 family protein [Imperialibacter roseus]|uniref:Nuclear transport factor 2 family protein n=1 Tax=Imperialibacter roseus TaxID=1324217 RepID=A0ABZ0IHG0_9BACT|nr:nuclear transport factor 2 family protein [Imperialibacter roseus]WOK04472.1 nuclear transport factor 2 family protein [Imperialibacter roseus]